MILHAFLEHFQESERITCYPQKGEEKQKY